MTRSRSVNPTAAHGLAPCIIALLALAGCGGGGSDGVSNPSPPSAQNLPPIPPSPASLPPDEGLTPTESPPNAPQRQEPPSTTGAADVNWLPPTSKEDGTVLTNLAGFRIYYGTSSSALEQMIDVANPGLTSYVIENLAAATWHFGVRAYTTDGVESALSNIASKTIP